MRLILNNLIFIKIFVNTDIFIASMIIICEKEISKGKIIDKNSLIMFFVNQQINLYTNQTSINLFYKEELDKISDSILEIVKYISQFDWK